MAFDGTTVAALVHELNEKIAGGHVQKIAQPEQDELLLLYSNTPKTFHLRSTAAKERRKARQIRPSSSIQTVTVGTGLAPVQRLSALADSPPYGRLPPVGTCTPP